MTLPPDFLALLPCTAGWQMSRTRLVLLAAAFVPAFIILAVTSVLWLVLEITEGEEEGWE